MTVQMERAVNLDDMSLGAVPEPTTRIAGALLLLPFGASTLPIRRKRFRQSFADLPPFCAPRSHLKSARQLQVLPDQPSEF
jgi:hypothetical protein